MKNLTISDLRPDTQLEPRSDRMKFSPRYMGSAKLSLRRPSRIPASSRRYIHGDPIQLIDWRAFARTDQLIVREQRDEASNRVLICLDHSPTMNWPEDPSLAPSKLEIAARLGFHLAHTHLKKGDMVQFYLYSFEQPYPKGSVRLKSTSDCMKSFELLSEHDFNIDAVRIDRDHQEEFSNSYDIGYFITDALEFDIIPRMFHSCRQLKLLHTLSSLEDSIDWMKDDICYFDESLTKKEYLGSSLKQTKIYENTLKQWKKNLKETCEKSNGEYLFLTNETRLSKYLSMIFEV